MLLTVSLVSIVIIFVVSWVPLGCFSLLADLDGYFGIADTTSLRASSERLYIGLAIVHVIAMSSAISNPIVYGWMNINIRHEFYQLLPFKRFKQRLQENNERTTTNNQMDVSRGKVQQ
ncbi:G-protein coupled receptor, putative [Pediculus humanus corporis]|uniref:G-protein coupled receptor, putative n=1 Tax=Pediculus humanus subsp. corporis TaxID=121224 RepID=E0VPC0_PEDHC|nr:G-protein coupled receptor, putative [Pediculus humanus corporis]EEB15226.1 G-protein coupled receptor, putative [Pediculus humanus corporis]